MLLLMVKAFQDPDVGTAKSGGTTPVNPKEFINAFFSVFELVSGRFL